MPGVTSTVYDNADPVERVALNITRIVRRHGSRTARRVQFGLKGADRHLFWDALTLATAAGFVARDAGGMLIPGRRNPDPFAEPPAPPHCETCSCQT